MKVEFEEMFERSKDDRAVIVGSEVREVIGEVRRLRSVIANAVTSFADFVDSDDVMEILRSEVTLEQARESWDSLSKHTLTGEMCFYAMHPDSATDYDEIGDREYYERQAIALNAVLVHGL
jgi:hypothetical protein